MSLIRSKLITYGRFTTNALQNLVTALPNQTLVVNYMTGISNAGGLFDLFTLINTGATNVPVGVIPCRGVLNSGFWSGRIVLLPGMTLQVEPANGGPGWDYTVGVFGFSLTS